MKPKIPCYKTWYFCVYRLMQSFKNWFFDEAKDVIHPVHPEVRKWAVSVEKLKKDLENLKDVLKKKKIDVTKDKVEKPKEEQPKDKEPIKPEKEKKPEEKPEVKKPENKPIKPEIKKPEPKKKEEVKIMKPESKKKEEDVFVHKRATRIMPSPWTKKKEPPNK